MSDERHVTIDETVTVQSSTATHHHHSAEELTKEQQEAYPKTTIAAGSSFVVVADEAFKETHQRGKKPKFDGFSLRNWDTQLEYRRNQNTKAKRASGTELVLESLPLLTADEVLKHNTAEDLWMAIGGIVYDCTAWQHYHPGGESILQACGGRDASQVYDFYHSWVSCEGLLGPYAVGRLQPSQ